MKSRRVINMLKEFKDGLCALTGMGDGAWQTLLSLRLNELDLDD